MQRQSYNTKILVAVVGFSSQEYIRAVKKNVTNTSPSKYIVLIYNPLLVFFIIYFYLLLNFYRENW
jgi:hypothetical protein